MSLLIAILVIVLITALILYLVDMLPVDGRLKNIIRIIVVFIAILMSLQKTGLV